MGPGPESAQFNRQVGNKVFEVLEAALANPLNQINRIGIGEPQPYQSDLTFDDVFQTAGLPPWAAAMMAFAARMFSDPVPGPPMGAGLRGVSKGMDIVPTRAPSRVGELAPAPRRPVEVLSPEEYRTRTGRRDFLDDFEDVSAARTTRFGDNWTETINIQPTPTGNKIRDFPDRVFKDDEETFTGVVDISEELLRMRFPRKTPTQISAMAEEIAYDTADELFNLMYSSQLTPHGYTELLGSEVLEHILPMLLEMQ